MTTAESAAAGTYSLEATARSDAPPERVFELLADATAWKQWGGPMIGSAGFEREGTPAPGGVGAVRRLGRWPQFSREEIVEYEPPNRMVYTLVSGLPVRDYRSEVRIEPDGDGASIVWRSTFRPKIPGTGAVLQALLARIIGGFARRLAAYAGRPGV